jgi:hypothetical protein
MMTSFLNDIVFGLTRGVQKFFLERPENRDLAGQPQPSRHRR